MNVGGFGEFSKLDIAEVKKITRLQIGFVQQCRDQALWMWRSYRVLHNDWQRRFKSARGKQRERLLKREPHKPFHNGLTYKVPIRIDVRTGVIEASNQIKLAPFVARMSTLKKGTRVIIPLDLAKYHEELLKKGRVVDFQLVKRTGKYYAYICVKYNVQDVPVQGVRAVDLGIRRAIATVLLRPGQPLVRRNLSIVRQGAKKDRLNRLNHRIAELQRARKWNALERLRHRRLAIAGYYDRLGAIQLAELARREESLIVVGYPKRMKYRNYRGNGARGLRRMLQQHFPYGREIKYIEEECLERGVSVETHPEFNTSRTCHSCGSMNTGRPTQSLFLCFDCGLQYNADWNSAINIGSAFVPVALGRRAREGLAYAGDEPVYKPGSLEGENPAGF